MWLRIIHDNNKAEVSWTKYDYEHATFKSRRNEKCYDYTQIKKAQGAFFLKFWPYVWLVFKSGF